MAIPELLGYRLHIFGLLLFVHAVQLTMPVLFAVFARIVDFGKLLVNETLLLLLVDLLVIVVDFSLVIEIGVQLATALSLGL